MGGLAAAIDLANRGCAVTVLEKAQVAGGKARQVMVGGEPIDAGPTVLTMRWVFDQLFEAAGQDLAARVRMKPIDTIARHVWQDRGQLDLYADTDRSADAIAEFAGPVEAEGYRRFRRDAARIYDILLPTFICDQRPSLFDLIRRVGLTSTDLFKLQPYATMWSALGRYFADPRLRQLFGRYATYCGSSPLRAPATLMLVAHVERLGVWSIDGGVHALAVAMHDLAVSKGVVFHFESDVAELVTKSGRMVGAKTRDGAFHPADAVLFNGDAQALNRTIRVGSDRHVVRSCEPRARSLSALTWCIRARTSGYPLTLHNVFFVDAYKREFDTIFRKRDIPQRPTVYICGQDRGGFGRLEAGQPERMLLIVNAPADGDRHRMSDALKRETSDRVFAFLSECGLQIDREDADCVLTTPHEFEQLSPSTGGALYGQANHGPFASFVRPGAATRLPGLYLAGGSVHPGPGVPMSAMSGRLAAARMLRDLEMKN